MYMKDWIQKLDDFRSCRVRNCLTMVEASRAEVAKLKANEEYDKFHERTQYQLSPVRNPLPFEAERSRNKKWQQTTIRCSTHPL